MKKKTSPPSLKALILTGGKSTRMGQDKFAITYHDRPQWQFLKNLLEKNGLEVYVSCRSEQAGDFAGEKVITDSFTDSGPAGAILSAFRCDPNSAWLALACDLPLFDETTLQFLLANRSPSAMATAFRQSGEEGGFPEPLAAIWEPKSHAPLLRFLAQGGRSPRKFLINTSIQLLDAPAPEALTNANTPEEKDAILEKYFASK